MPRIIFTFIALVTAIALASCGSKESSSSSGPASLAPAGAAVYGEVTLDPSDDQQADIEALIQKFPGKGSAGERIRGLLEKAFAESGSGLSFEDDVEPWLGDEAGFFVSDFGGGDHVPAAALVATEDEDKAADAIAKAAKSDDGKTASYRGHDYYAIDDGAAGVVDGWVVIGSLSGFKDAIDTAEGGRPLEDDETFQKTLADAPEERLGFVYVNTPALVDNLKKSSPAASLGPFADILKDPVLATLDVNEHGARLETVLPASLGSSFLLGEGSGGAADLPADAWLGFAQKDLGATINQLLTSIGSAAGGRGMIERQLEAATGLDLQKDVIAWMGDWSLFVRGTSVAELDGALVVETKDEAASKRFIEAIERLVRKSVGDDEHLGPLQVPGGGEGATFRTPEIPKPIHLFQRDGKVVLAYGDAAAADALAPASRLGDTQEYKDAQEGLGGDYDLSFYVAVAPILDLVDSTGAGDDEGWTGVKPYLEPLGALVVGAKKEGDKLRAALGITVK